MSIGIGDALTGAREALGRTLQDAARDTRVRLDYLRALEDEQFEIFGGDVYAKGFLSTYAKYLNVDPAPLLDLYRDHAQHDDYNPSAIAPHPVQRPRRDGLPPVLVWGAIGAFLLVVAIGVSQAVGGRNPAPAAQPSPTIAASVSPSPTPARSASPSPSPSPTFDGVQVMVFAESDCWMRVTSDGTNVFEGVVAAGEVVEFNGTDLVAIRFGNPGAVRVEVNGADQGAPGQAGRPATVSFDRDGQVAA